MTRLPRSKISACWAILFSAGAGLSFGVDRELVLEFDPALFTEPSNGIVELAEKHAIQLTGIGIFEDRDHLETNDSVTLMITSLKDGISKQWLLSLTVSELTAKEEKRALPPAQTLYSTSGHQFTFDSQAAALSLSTWGPVNGTVGAKPNVQFPQRHDQARDLVNPVFLAVGLNDTSNALMRLHKARTDGLVDPSRKIGILTTPAAANISRDGLDLVTKAGLSLDDERAIAGSVPAMLEFFEIAARSKGLREILWEIIDKPSFWSILRRFGRVEAGISFHSKGVQKISSKPWGLPDSVPVFQIPFTLDLNDEPALDCVMVVTEPQPPLLTSAGIIGLSAHEPGAKDRRAAIRLLAAHAGTKPQTDN